MIDNKLGGKSSHCKIYRFERWCIIIRNRAAYFQGSANTVSMLRNFKQTLNAHSNLRSHLWQTSANYTQTAGGMLVGILLARMLSPAVFGEFVLISSIVLFLMTPLSFSPAQLLVSDRGRTPQLFERVMGMTWLVTGGKLVVLFGFVVWALSRNNFQTACVGLLVGLPAALSDWTNVIKSDLEGRGLFRPNFVVQIVQVSTHACVTIGLVWAGWGIYGLAVGGFVGFLPSAAVYLALTERHVTQGSLNTGIFFDQLRSGFWLWLGSVSATWFSRVDKLLLGHWGGDTQLGLYNRATNYGPVSHIALNSLMTNATVRALAGKKTLAEKKRLFSRTMGIVLAGGTANGLFWWILAEPLVPLIFSEQWRSAIPSFQILGWLGVPYLLVYGSSTVLLAENKFAAYAIIQFLGLLLLTASLFTVSKFTSIDSLTTSLVFIFSMACCGALMTAMAVRLLFFPQPAGFPAARVPL